MQYEKIKHKPSQFQSLTGLSIKDFDILCADFSIEFTEYISHYTFEGKRRNRCYYPKRTSCLPRIEDKLFFTLIFLKTNPLQEHHAASFGLTQPKTNMLLHLFIPLLRKTLKRLGELPNRNAYHLEELLKNHTDVLLDGTERPIQKPSDYQIADEYYSGKKKLIA